MNKIDLPDLHELAVSAFQKRDWDQAYYLSVSLLERAPQHAHSCYIAGLAAMEMQRWSQALAMLRKASEIEPRQADYAAQLARALAITNVPGEALRAANRSSSLSPTDAHTFDTLGVVYTRCNAHERAACFFRRAVNQAPTNPVYRFNLATSLMYAGAIAAAREELHVTLEQDPYYWLAHFMLSRLDRQTSANNHVDRLLSLASQTVSDSNAQMYLHMALGKEYEDLGNYPRAFEHFKLGKSAVSPVHAEPMRHSEALFDALTQTFPKDTPKSHGCLTEEPIFIVGMPRTGTTLVERIISSHPYVYSAGELQNFGIALKHESGTRTPSLLDVETVERIPKNRWQELGEKYLSSTRPLTECKPYFVDKLPHNFLYIGYIINALPNAKIICLRRNPMDTCLSNFRELFTKGLDFFDYSLDLMDTGRYYVLYHRLIEHWRQIFPGRFLEIDYEELVNNQEATTRQMLEYCGLPWHAACLRFDQNDAPSTTASAVQVRAPIHQEAIRRWKKYEVQLSGLRELLAEAGIDCD